MRVTERTFVMIKPDGVGRRLIGELIGRYERKGLKLVGLKLLWISRELAEKHYAAHRGRPYYEPLVAFVTSAPSVVMVWEGDNAIAVVRQLNGATDAFQADIGSIRGDFALTVRHNLVHGSDSAETARREIGLYFRDEELVSYAMPDEQWLHL